MTPHGTPTPQPNPSHSRPVPAHTAARATSTPHPGPETTPHNPSTCTDPVFVLTAGRSGSTLLRFILDAHPDLACPPETELASVCSQLAAVWSMFAVSTWPGKQANGSAATNEPVIVGLRHLMDLMIGPYLARRGKKRYCDKSLGSARHAALLTQMYPEGRFLCLYRHPMDLIASGLEACPWGLNSYGFEHYIGGSPANAVAAIARYWADHTAAVLAAEEQFPGRCHRVRYEDLVRDPGATAAEIFEFLGVTPVPGIEARFFSHERERFGRADFKIWNTSQITTGSVGRGWSVPVSLIPPPLLTTLNDLAGRLGYRPIDEAWGTGNRPANMLATANGQARYDVLSAPGGAVGMPPGSHLLAERIAAGLARLGDSFSHRWDPHSSGRFLIMSTTPEGAVRDASWLVDLPARTAVPGDGHHAGAADWRATGTATAWEQIINGDVNLGVAFRQGHLRYVGTGDAGPGTVAGDTRVAMMADLLGITTWPSDANQAE